MASPSYLRVTKSETRDLAEHAARTRRAETEDSIPIGNGQFFAAFVVIMALLAILALVLR
jgi:hypothetical protein